MWWKMLMGVNLLAYVAVAVPTHGDVAKTFQTAIDHQSLATILMSIEERLRSLDSLYSMHLSPTLQDKLDQYHRKLDAIDVKIIRLESLVMLNLDKISENISTKNFKDDVARTNLAKKIDAVYEGISHRLGYMDRKLDTQSTKTQVKLDASLTRLEQIEDGIVRRDEDIEAELSDAIAAIDDLKTGNAAMEEIIRNETRENFQGMLRNQKAILENHVSSNLMFKTLLENASGGFEKIQEHLDAGLQQLNVSESFIADMKAELKGDLNEYAIKVGEMNSENWKSGKALLEKQASMESAINSTKTEVQNGLRTLMVLVGKNTNKDPADQEIDKLNDKLDSNFEKVFSAQSSFMDNCYRLQMDESQIESKISEILEKLVETFEKKTAIEIKDIQNLEYLLKNHDLHINRHLHQIGSNVVTVYEKLTKDNQNFDSCLSRLREHLDVLFSLVQDTLADENGSAASKNFNVLSRSLAELKATVISLDEQGKGITAAVEQIRGLVEIALAKNSTTTTSSIDEHLSNITQIVREIEAKINTSYPDHTYNRSNIGEVARKFEEQLHKFMETVNGINITRNASIHISGVDSGGVIPETLQENSGTDQTKSNGTSDIDALIDEVFGSGRSTSEENATETPSTTNKCKSYLDLIDVRSGTDDINCGQENDENSGGGDASQPNKIIESLDGRPENGPSSSTEDYEEIRRIVDQVLIVDNEFGGGLQGNRGNDYGTLEITRIQ